MQAIRTPTAGRASVHKENLMLNFHRTIDFEQSFASAKLFYPQAWDALPI